MDSLTVAMQNLTNAVEYGLFKIFIVLLVMLATYGFWNAINYKK